MISRNAVITFLTVLLFVGLILFVVFGCIDFNGATTFEHFADKDEADKEEKSKDEEKKDKDTKFMKNLSMKEKELFEDLKENKLSNEQIGELVSNGVLTEKLIEKFLDHLNEVPEDGKDTTSTEKIKKMSKAADEKKKSDKEEEFTLEGFTGEYMYAKF